MMLTRPDKQGEKCSPATTFRACRGCGRQWPSLTGRGILKKKRSMMKRISRLNKEAAALETCGKRQKLLLLTPEVSAL